jgi:L-gulonate 3-dehydrogenase
MTSVAVIGTGLIGRAWAICFARAGHEVRLWSHTPGKANEAAAYVQSLLPDLEAFGLLHGLSAAAVFGNLHVVTDLKDALAQATYVQENVLEDVTIKRALFAQLDTLAQPDTILASSTSAIPASQFTEALHGRARCVVAHPLNPPYLMPAVEIVPSRWSAPHTVEATTAFMTSLGQSPIVMSQEDQGFVTIRLQGALLQEAFRIVNEGLASPEDVDRAIREGLALRWSVVGPFETIDLNSPNGVREYVQRYQPLYAKLASEHTHLVDWAGPVLATIEQARRSVLPIEKLAQRQLWRDRQMMSLAAQRANANRSAGQ